jgi:hypothetical protein
MVHIVASVENYSDLLCALRCRRLDLWLSVALDDAAGVADGYSSKIECRSKRLGDMALGAILKAMGCKLALIADDDALPAITRRFLYTSGYSQAAKGPPAALPMVEATIPASDGHPEPALALLEAA